MRERTLPALLLIFFLVLLSLNTCKSKKEREPVVEDFGLSAPGKLNQEQFLRRLETINPGLRDPSGIITLIEMTGAEFNPGMVNNSGYVSQYLADSTLAALNLGVYTVDLVYLLAYNQNEKADSLIENTRLLAERIGAGHLYDHGMYQRYRAAGVPSDTLIQYFSKSAEKLEHDYRERQLQRLYTLFATGEFIEKLHLTTSLLIDADREDLDQYWTLMILFFQQEKALDNLIQLLEHVRGNEEGERFMAMMKDMKLMYRELNSSSEMSGINTGNIVDNQIFNDMVEQLGIIHNRIIHPE